MINRALAKYEPYATIQAAVEDLLWGIRTGLDAGCPDPNGYGPSLDAAIDVDARRKIQETLLRDWYSAQMALETENAGDERAAIAHWQSVFGSEFPAYG